MFVNISIFIDFIFRNKNYLPEKKNKKNNYYWFLTLCDNGENKTIKKAKEKKERMVWCSWWCEEKTLIYNKNHIYKKILQRVNTNLLQNQSY